MSLEGKCPLCMEFSCQCIPMTPADSKGSDKRAEEIARDLARECSDDYSWADMSSLFVIEKIAKALEDYAREARSEAGET
jgi:hypothetical protein